MPFPISIDEVALLREQNESMRRELARRDHEALMAEAEARMLTEHLERVERS
jgi:hypothetical protein